MELTVAGATREELAREVSDAAAALAAREDAPEFLKYPFSAVFLNSSRDGQQYLKRMLSLLTDKTGVSTAAFYIPRRPGLKGRLVATFKTALWKLFRYQHDRITFQQNMINLQLTAAIEFLHEEHRRELDALHAEIAELREGKTSENADS